MTQSEPRDIQRRYRVLAALGEGGAAKAYRVWDEAAEEERALKLVQEEAIEVLRGEFALLAGLYHPRLIRVHDFGLLRQAGRRTGFYTAELLRGVSLGDYAAEHDWSATRLAIADALEGLAFLHGLGIRHGDFKPDNVLVDEAGRATLIDLSCAGRMDVPISALSGTPGFMAPELAPGIVVDGRADLFAVGVTLKQLAPKTDGDAVRLVARLCDADRKKRPGEVADVLAALGDGRLLSSVTTGRSPRIMGRRKEMHAFEELFEHLLADEDAPRAMILCGPSGMGKSRLLAEMKWHAQLRCEVIESPPPADGEPRAGMLQSLLYRAGRGDDVQALQPGQRAGLDAILLACEKLSRGAEPRLLLIDDADRLLPDELAQLEAIMRSLPRRGRLMVLATSARPLAEGASALRLLKLAPLPLEAVQSWMGTLIDARRAPELRRVTGGTPAYLEAALRELASGRLLEEDLANAPLLTGAAQVALLVRALPSSARLALAILVASSPRLNTEDGAGFEEALGQLAADGVVVGEAEGYLLARPSHRQAFEEALGDDLMAEGSRVLASRLLERGVAAPRATQRAALLRSLVRSGQVPQAEELLLAHPARAASDARHWSDALEAVTRVSRHQAPLLMVAQVQLDLGRAPRALSALARVMGQRPQGANRARALLLAGTAYLQLEAPTRAVRYLQRALSEAEGHERLGIASRLTRALNQTGDYAAAAQLAETHLTEARCQPADDESEPADDDSEEAVALSGGLGVAACYLGHSEVAKLHLERAAEGTSDERNPRDAVRARSYLAILAFRSGDPAAAASHHAQALEIAERRHLSDMLPTLVLNLGTARQQLGDWGEALTLYERGHRIAVALGKTHAQAILELNIANLYADIGLGERAASMLDRAKASIARAGIDHLDGQLHFIGGEAAIARDATQVARHGFECARAEYQARGAKREQAEACLSGALLALLPDGEGSQAARSCLQDARQLLVGLDAEDVAARLEAIDGLAALASGFVAEAASSAARALALAKQSAQSLIVAETSQALGRVRRAEGDERAAAALDEDARTRWQQVAITLPVAMRDEFWRHPRRRSLALAPQPESSPMPSGSASDGGRLRRMLELSARVSATLSLDRVLEVAMDAAIELTSAERGFLLLREQGDSDALPLRVVAARNIDAERLGQGNLEFSQGIAQQVVRTGESVVTLDARSDARFASNRSVHAMRLKSVACVPVSAQGQLIGALYLDNRFERGRFQDQDVGVVQAFANHIAMAVKNARLHAALKDNNRQLAAEKRQVQRLSRGQAVEIAELKQRVMSQQQVLARRFDYSAISHESPAMRAVLDVLDRVIDSELTMLIEGESGSGKERIVRAIHVNSPRSEGPFVAINCGALSETLLESELFGHVRGAFTGADRDRTGLMVAAAGGTLFLDEVGEMPLSMQAKLLRALQEREVRPLGAVDSIALDLRLVCATNRHLRSEVEAGRFREDLYYRIGVVELRLPPLRERREDILAIAHTMLAGHANKADTQPLELARDAAAALLKYAWPGNVRQLENVLARAYVLSDRKMLRAADLDLSAGPRRRNAPRSRAEFEEQESQRIQQALLDNGWNVSRAARALEIPRNTLYRKLERLKLMRPG